MTITDQPPPILQPERTPVWSLVIADYRTFQESSDGGDDIDRRVVSDMHERDRLGRERYQTPLTTHNGRDHLVDAYHEALDFAVYLRAWLEEHPIVAVEHGGSIRANTLRRRIDDMYRDHLSRLWGLRYIIDTRSAHEKSDER